MKLAKSPAEAKQLASEILGMQLVTHQTGPEGKLVRKVYVDGEGKVVENLLEASATAIEKERQRRKGSFGLKKGELRTLLYAMFLPFLMY